MKKKTAASKKFLAVIPWKYATDKKATPHVTYGVFEARSLKHALERLEAVVDFRPALADLLVDSVLPPDRSTASLTRLADTGVIIGKYFLVPMSDVGSLDLDWAMATSEAA